MPQKACERYIFHNTSRIGKPKVGTILKDALRVKKSPRELFKLVQTHRRVQNVKL